MIMTAFYDVAVRRRLRWILIGLAALALIAWLAMPYVASAAFILDLSGKQLWIRKWLPVSVRTLTTHDVEVPTRYGPIPARVYEPSGKARISLLVIPGVHAGGVDEPRLATFSRRLAGGGARVVSLPLPDLRKFKITARSTDMVEDAALWMLSNRELVPDGRVAIGGVSFSAGLALVAAGRPSLDGKLQFVLALGAHHDLPTVLTYLCDGVRPGGIRPPHAYGVAVLLLGAVDKLVPPAQAAPMKAALLTGLRAASDQESDPARAQAEREDANRILATLGEPAHTYLEQVIDQNVAALGPVLRPFVDELGSDPALSPKRSPITHVPVFLLHGSDDPIIPWEETENLAADLRARGNSHVEWLVSPVLAHVEIATAVSISDAWRLVRFWTKVDAQAGR